jgi:group I intron endonuclease
MASKFIIYGLADPRTGQLRYVGKSTYGLKRARSHAYPGYLKRDHSHTGNWIRSLKAQGMRPEAILLEVYENRDDLPEAEIWNIAYWKSLGAGLYNHTLGGEGCVGRKMSPETKRKLREANLGNKHALGKKQDLTQEQRTALVDRARARSADPTIRAKISATLSGRKNGPHSAERRAKISAAVSKSIWASNGKVYKSAVAASRELGVHRSHICLVLKGKVSAAKGYTFKYVE